MFIRQHATFLKTDNIEQYLDYKLSVKYINQLALFYENWLQLWHKLHNKAPKSTHIFFDYNVHHTHLRTTSTHIFRTYFYIHVNTHTHDKSKQGV